MAQTVKITPASGLLEFIGDVSTNKPYFQHDNAGNLSLTLQATKKFTVGGNLKVNGKVTMAQQTLTDGASITWDFNNGANAKVTLGGARVLSISNIETGDTGIILVKQDNTGGRTLSLPAGSVIVGGGSYTATSTANSTDVLGVYYDGTNYFWTIGYDTVATPLTSIGIVGSDFIISNSPLTANGNISLALATVNSNVGTFGSASAVPVITVNGKGLITAVSTTNISIPTNLDSLTDVTITSPSTSQLLRYNGSQWVNWTPNYITGITSGDVTTALGYTPVPNTRALTINGTTYDLTADRTWTINTVSYTSKLQHNVKAGVAINKGQAVYVIGGDGTNMIVGLASNTSEATSSKTMGLLDATVAINGMANVVTEGLLAGIDTSSAGAEGDPVWLGTNGNLIYGLANKPYAPTHLVFIGIVTRKQQINGEIFVKVQNGFELQELHNVDLITTVPVNGHILGYNGTLWVNKTIAQWLGFTPANDSNVVHKTGDETVAGIKTFTGTGLSAANLTRFLDTSTNFSLYVSGDISGLTLSTGSLGQGESIHFSADQRMLSFSVNNTLGAKLVNGGRFIIADGLYNDDLVNKLQVQGGGYFTGNSTANAFVKIAGTSTQFLKADGTVDSNTYALDSGVVHTTGNETIGGIKTFSNTTQATSTTTGAVIVSGGVGIAKNLYVGGDLNVVGNLVIGGTTTTVYAQNLSVSDNMIYLNNGILTTITNVVGNGSTVVYTTQETHNYTIGMTVTITGVSPSAYNLSNQTITAVSTNSFTVANSATGTYSSGGTARAKSNANPDLGWAAGYNDGSYAHAGLFRDATDGVFKFFKGYTPEPDASPFIDTAHASFALADLSANDITARSFIKSGGTSSQFLKADGSVDSNTYLTTVTAASTYQPLDADLTAIAGLTSTGFLKRTGSNTWTLDSNTYLTSYTETDTLASVTGRGASTSTAVTFNSNVTLGNNADLIFRDLSGTFPTSGKGFDWTLNDDGARIYAIQPSSDTIDLVFQLRDNATTNDRFVFHVQEWQGAAFDKYPLIIRGGTEFDLVDSGLFIRGTQVITNGRVLQNVTGNISMFTNNAGYITGYTETDTLATVTGRGASTNTTLTLAKVITTGLYGPSTNGNIAIWQYDASNTGYGIVYNEGSPDTLRIDVSGQALSGTPDFLIGGDYAQINGNTVWHAGNLTNLNQLVNGPGYITGYTETDTLATVTGRGSTTTTNISAARFLQNAHSTSISNASYSNESAVYANATETPADAYPGFGFHKSNRLGLFLYATDATTLRLRGDNGADYLLYHSGNLTNLNQLTNGPGYITGITSSNVTTALGYTPVTNARTLSINGTSYDLSANRSWSVGTVTSVGGTGTVSGLTLSGTVTGSGNLTLGGTLTLTSANVTTALGYTPYNSTNPNGYISSYTETDTLATVTARGATTSTNSTFTGGLWVNSTLRVGANYHISQNANGDLEFRYI